MQNPLGPGPHVAYINGGEPPPNFMAQEIPGGGGGMQAGISAFQMLYHNFVRNLFGGFKDLCR